MSSRSNNLLDVLNLVLAKLGEIEDSSYENPDTDAGKKVKRILPSAIDEVQREYLWSELITSAPLLSTDTEYEYEIPADSLRPLDIIFPELPIHPYLESYSGAYELKGNKVITMSADPILEYIKRSDDPTEWSSELEDCIVLNAAINSGYLVTDNSSLINSYTQKYESLNLPRAKTLQAKKNTNVAKHLPANFRRLRARNH